VHEFYSYLAYPYHYLVRLRQRLCPCARCVCLSLALLSFHQRALYIPEAKSAPSSPTGSPASSPRASSGRPVSCTVDLFAPNLGADCLPHTPQFISHRAPVYAFCVLGILPEPLSFVIYRPYSMVHCLLSLSLSLFRFSFVLVLTTTCHRFASPLRVPSSPSKFLMRPKSKAMALYPKNKCSSS